MEDIEIRKENAIKKEKEIQKLLDKIETMDGSLKGINDVRGDILETLLDYYYTNDFNEETLTEEHGLLGFVGIEKVNNTRRIIRLLMDYRGMTKKNEYKIQLVLHVLHELEKEDNKKNQEIYERTHSGQPTL